MYRYVAATCRLELFLLLVVPSYCSVTQQTNRNGFVPNFKDNHSTDANDVTFPSEAQNKLECWEKVKNLEAEKQYLLDLVASLQRELSETLVRVKRGDCESDLSKCIQDKDNATTTLSTCNTDKDNLTTSLSTCNTTLTSTNTSLSNCNFLKNILTSQLAGCNSGRISALTLLNGCNTILNSCNTDKDNLTTSLATCNTTLTSSNGNITTLTNLTEKCTTDLEKKTGDLNTCNKDLNKTLTLNQTTCNSDLETCKKEKAVLDKALSSCSSNKSVCATRLKTCRSELKSYENACDKKLHTCSAHIIREKIARVKITREKITREKTAFRKFIKVEKALKTCKKKTGDKLTSQLLSMFHEGAKGTLQCIEKAFKPHRSSSSSSSSEY